MNVNVNWNYYLINETPKQLTIRNIREGKEIFLIDNFLSKEEYSRVGYGTTNYPKHYCDNWRLIVNDKELTEILWLRIKDYLPQTNSWRGWFNLDIL